MRIVHLLTGVFIGAVCLPTLNGQTPRAPSHPNNTLPQWVYETERKRRASEWLQPKTVRPPSRRSVMLIGVVNTGLPDQLVTNERIQSRLAPPTRYWAEHMSVLRKGGSGLFRIFPANDCDKGLTLSAADAKKCLDFIPIKGGGSYYSLRFLSNLPLTDETWDLRYVDGRLVGGNRAVEIFLTETNKKELGDIKKGDRVYDRLAAFKPGSTVAEIGARKLQLDKGIHVNGDLVTSSVKATNGAVYGMRIVAKKIAGSDQVLDKVGRGIDAILVFKIVGEEADGSLIVLWKSLRSDEPASTLER